MNVNLWFFIGSVTAKVVVVFCKYIWLLLVDLLSSSYYYASHFKLK